MAYAGYANDVKYVENYTRAPHRYDWNLAGSLCVCERESRDKAGRETERTERHRDRKSRESRDRQRQTEAKE